MKELTIGIIGAGKLGTAIARVLIKAGYSVQLSQNENSGTIQRINNEPGAEFHLAGSTEVVKKDVIILAVRWEHIEEALSPLRLKLKGKIINDKNMNTETIKSKAIGVWQSIAAELRPGQQRNPDGSLKPFYLTRQFTLREDDGFDLKIVNFADPFGKLSIAELFISGHLIWQGPHPIADGAQKVDFMADADYIVTPLLQNFSSLLNQITTGFNKWEINDPQSIFKKDFPPFGLQAGQIFKEFDLMHLSEGLMFWGARNVDGRGFGCEDDRPTNLQIPMRPLNISNT